MDGLEKESIKICLSVKCGQLSRGYHFSFTSSLPREARIYRGFRGEEILDRRHARGLSNQHGVSTAHGIVYPSLAHSNQVNLEQTCWELGSLKLVGHSGIMMRGQDREQRDLVLCANPPRRTTFRSSDEFQEKAPALLSLTTETDDYCTVQTYVATRAVKPSVIGHF